MRNGKAQYIASDDIDLINIVERPLSFSADIVSRLSLPLLQASR
jgi:hypothetical protein